MSIGFIILLHCPVKAQTNTTYLYKTGKVDSLYSRVLQEERVIYVRLPEGYSRDSEQKYPVAYILDGEVLLPTADVMLGYYEGGFIPEMIVIGISNRKHRIRDLTPSKITRRYGMPFNQENGEAEAFYRFLEEELVPFVESRYPATSYRTLVGHSFGGLFAIYTLIHHPELFQNYLAIDPSLDWDHQKVLEEARRALPDTLYREHSLYMSLNGQLHMQDPQVTIDNVMEDTSSYTLFARSNIAFRNLARRHPNNGLSFDWEFFPNELHGTIAYPSMHRGLVWLFEWFQMEQTAKFNSPESPKKELDRIIHNRSEKLKKHFGYRVPPYPRELLDMLGYMSLDWEQPEKAKMFFEYAMDYYPNNAEVYNSLADYYENQRDYRSAIKYLSKAYSISGRTSYRERMEQLKEKIRNRP